jgi:hypothetical protein
MVLIVRFFSFHEMNIYNEMDKYKKAIRQFNIFFRECVILNQIRNNFFQSWIRISDRRFFAETFT